MKAELAGHDKPELREKIKGFENQLKGSGHQKMTLEDKRGTLRGEVEKMRESKDGHEAKHLEYRRQLVESMEIGAKIEIALEVATGEFNGLRRQYEEERRDRNRLKQEAESIEHAIK